MIKIILTLLLLTSYSFALEKEDLKLGDREFSRWVRPTLRNLVNDYLSLYQLIQPQAKGIVAIYSSMKKVYSNSQGLQVYCKNDHKLCLQKMESLIELVHRLHIRFENIQTKDYLDKNQVNNALTAAKNLEDLRLKITEIYFKLDNISQVFKVNHHDLTHELKKINNLVRNLDDYYFIFLSNIIRKDLSKDFLKCWNFYIRPIAHEVLRNDNPSHLIRNINDLNYSWHKFHQPISKIRQNIPKSVKSLMNVMNNRWNSVLKIMIKIK